MSDYGTIVEVALSTLGDELAADASIGATSLTVIDPADFSEDGGTLQVGAETIIYTACDDETGIITLGSATTATHLTGDRVTRYPLGQEKWATVALGDDSESITALVPQTLWPLLAEGIRAGTGEQVIVDEYDDESWVISDVLGAIPLVDGSFLDPTATVPPLALSDGLPPAASAVPVVTGLAKQLLAQISGVVNHDAVSYEWHIDVTTTTPTLGDATTHHKDGATMAVFATLADGVTALDYVTTYYVGVFAIDIDGASSFSGWSAPAMLNPNGTPDIAVGAILAANIDVADLLAAGIRTADDGQRVTISTAEGIVVYDSLENVRASFPTTADDFTINADATLTSATITDKLTLRGVNNVFAKQSSATLEAVVNAPLSPPTTAVGWPAIVEPSPDSFRPTDFRRGLYFYSGQVWMGHRAIGNGFLTPYNPTTGAYGSGQFGLPNHMQPDGGIVHMTISGNNRWISMCKQDTDNTWWVVITDDLGVLQTSYNWILGSTGKGAAISTDGTNILICQRTTGATYRVWTYTTSFSLVTTTDFTATIGSPVNSEVNGLYWGNADYGAARVAISLYDDAQVRVFNTSGTEQSNVRFNVANGERVGGLAWDGSNFWTSSRDAFSIYKYSNIFKDTATSLVWPAYTWKDTDATGGTHETPMSTQTSKTVQRRQSITVTTPDIPDNGGTDDPDSVGLYLGYNGTIPARTAMWLHTTPASGVRTATISSQVTSGTNPPASTNFPGTTAFRFNAADGTGLMSGDQGFPAEQTYTPVWSTGGGTPSLGSTGTIVGSYIRKGKEVTVRIKMTFGGTGINAGTGVYAWSYPLTPAYSSNEAYVGGGMIDDASGTKTGGYTAGASTATTLGLWNTAGRVSATNPQAPATGDIYELMFTYFIA